MAVLWLLIAVCAGARAHDRVAALARVLAREEAGRAARRVNDEAHRELLAAIIAARERDVLRAARIGAVVADTLLWPILALPAAVVLIDAASALARVTPADALTVAELCCAAAGLTALYKSSVLRAERIVAIVADLVTELVVHLAATDVLLTEAHLPARLAEPVTEQLGLCGLPANTAVGAALRRGRVDAVRGVLVAPPCLAPLVAEAPALRWQENRVLAVEDLMAPLAAGRVVLLAELGDEQLEALVAAAARNVRLCVAARLAAEEEVRAHFCFIL